jgi:hypothetical protein
MNDKTKGSVALLSLISFLVYYTIWTLFTVRSELDRAS